MLSDETEMLLEGFNNRLVAHPGYRKIKAQIDRMLNKSGKVKNPKGLLIYGDAGVGKSTIAEKITEEYPPYEQETDFEIRRKTPVLYVRVPSPVTTKGVIVELFNALGQVAPDKTELKMTADLAEAFIACGVKMLILDETQHFLDKAAAARLTSIRNWMKSLIDKIQIPIVFIGSTEAKGVITGCKQLDRRVKYKKRIAPFNMPRDEQASLHKVLTLLLDAMKDHCDIKLDTSIHSLELSQRFYLASGGNMDAIRGVLSESIEIALVEETKVLTLEHLSKGFLMAPPPTALIKKNPFEISAKKLQSWHTKKP